VDPPEIEMVPGVTAATAAAALLGAPLNHDFAVLSLSDLLTPWPVVMQRLEAAARADLVLALYNPTSRRRAHRFAEALALLRTVRRPQTPVGIVTNAYRDGQRVTVTDLATVECCPVDMLTVLIVGNSRTRVLDGRIVTPRGYDLSVPETSTRPAELHRG
jgi:precorrin-3B C17-methyltransferase